MTAVRVRRIFSPLTCRCWVTYLLTDYIMRVCPSAYNTKLHPDAIPAWEKNWEGT